MTNDRRLAALTGGLYLLTFATSIPALPLKRAFLDGDGTTAMLNGAVILEIVLALACIGTAVAFYPVGKRYNPALALGFVASRTLEASAVVTGVIALLSVGTLRSLASSGDADAGAADAALVAVHDAAVLLGPGLMPAVNALLFGTLLYRARLVPRIIPLVGLIGAPLLLLSVLGTLLGLIDQVSPLAGLAALPIAIWEFSIGIWLLVKGFRPSAVPPAPQQPATHFSLRSQEQGA
ncbi:MAG: DUF4386 domain-containing protein [Leifsonia xyli]|nr:MAG: DUF4386 domain-containing protein [Leifsonia xyli]